MKETFIMKTNFLTEDDIALFTPEEIGLLMIAWSKYVNTGEQPTRENLPLHLIVKFNQWKEFHLACEQKYQEKVERMSKAQKKSFSDRKGDLLTEEEQIESKSKSKSESKSDYTEKTNANALVKEKSPPTHTYGEYQHVKLKDSDVVKLQTEYGPTVTSDAIRFLDEYIEEKGYKAKNHYLSIRRWVIDALKERQQAKTVPKKSIEEINLENYRRQFEREVANEQETNIKLFGLPEPSVLAKAR